MPINTGRGQCLPSENSNPELGDFLELMVEDDGIGVPESALDKIFDRFYQVRMVPLEKSAEQVWSLYITKNWCFCIKERSRSQVLWAKERSLQLPALPTETANEEEE